MASPVTLGIQTTKIAASRGVDGVGEDEESICYSTLTFCSSSIPDPAESLKEKNRVIRREKKEDANPNETTAARRPGFEPRVKSGSMSALRPLTLTNSADK